MMNKVAVVGQGYVGLPIALAAAKNGYFVFGVDTNISKIENLANGISHIEGVDSTDLMILVSNKSYTPTTDFSKICDVDIILICVPTPLDSNSNPDLSFLLAATKSVGKNLSKGALVVIESTVATGTTREILTPILERESRLHRDDFFVSFSPERIDPLNEIWNVRNTPKVVAGLTDKACDMAINFYDKFIDKTIRCESLEVAETSKLLENSFRLINISFINEMALFCNKFGIEINHVIAAAATKPYGFLPFYPSIGIGGHCIPVDPIYLAEKAREIGASSDFIDLASRINKRMPAFFVKRAADLLGDLKGKKILVIGVSYKPNVADTRETPVEALLLQLRKYEARVFWHDNLVQEWNNEQSVPISDDYDLVILATPHDYLDLTQVGRTPILNTRGSI
jgi:UDP-N-acetyl-D-glucosamine dehydrogenase